MTGPSTYTASVGSIAHIPCTFTAHTLPADPRFFALLWNLGGKEILTYDNNIKSTDSRYFLDKDRALNGNADLIISNVSVSDAGDYTCYVIYSPVRIQRKIRVDITAAALQMTGPSTYTARVGSIAHIPCTFTSHTLPADPRFFAVLWNLEGKEILTYDRKITSTNPRYSLDKDRALNGNADLIISNVSVSDAGDYTCSVIDSPVRIQRKISVFITATPAITIVNKVITKRTKSNLHGIIIGFFPVDIDIKWLRDGQTLDNVIIEKPQRNPDGTYSVNSSVIITPTEEDRKWIFSCRVQHKSLIEPLQEDFQLLYSVQPQLTILTKSVQRNTQNTLACMVTGFFPPDIVVTWYKDGEVLNDQLMGELHKNDNGTYQVISMVTITPSYGDQNRIFSCRVQHISLQEPLQESRSSDQVFRCHVDSSCYAIVVCAIVVPLVLVQVLVINGIILWTQSNRRKASSYGKVKGMEEGNRQQNSDNDIKSYKDEEKIPLNMNKGQLPDLKVGQITVPKLIAGRRATLSCKLYNYIPGEHTCSWYVKLKSGGEIPADYDKKIQSTTKDETSDDQNTYITDLGLVPVMKSDDGSEFILRVNLPDRVIETSSGAVHVRAKLWLQTHNKSEKEKGPSKRIQMRSYSSDSGITMSTTSSKSSTMTKKRMKKNG